MLTACVAKLDQPSVGPKNWGLERRDSLLNFLEMQSRTEAPPTPSQLWAKLWVSKSQLWLPEM